MGKQGARGKATVPGAALHRRVMRSCGSEQHNAADLPTSSFYLLCRGERGHLRKSKGSQEPC